MSGSFNKRCRAGARAYASVGDSIAVGSDEPQGRSKSPTSMLSASFKRRLPGRAQRVEESSRPRSPLASDEEHQHSCPNSSDTEAQSGEHISLMQFALQLLSDDNSAVEPDRQRSRTGDESNACVAHHWIASSHNSYIIGDQLTGRSSADACKSCRSSGRPQHCHFLKRSHFDLLLADRRQLLQGCRHVEVNACTRIREPPRRTHRGSSPQPSHAGVTRP
eukprot:2572364-Prymnesium_polylepis.1